MQSKSNQSVTVLFIWDVRQELREYLKKPFEQEVEINLLFPTDLSDENLIKLARNADIIVGWRPSKDLLDAAEKLKLYINPGAGVQHLLKMFKELNQSRKVILINGHGNSYFTAQHAVAILLTLLNQIIPHHQWMMKGKWRTGDKDSKSTPLRDRKIGLLGYGAVNSKVHRFLSGFSNEFAVIRRSWEKDIEDLPTAIQKFTPNQLNEFLDLIDTLIIAVPQTDKTTDLISTEEIKKLGKNGILINMARGSVVNEEALYDALKNRTILGAAIDVWYDYKPEANENGKKYPFHFPFHELDNIILSPHRGASPFSDLKRWDEVVENIHRLHQKRADFLNQVDIDAGY